jgi:hypothetical protein
MERYQMAKKGNPKSKSFNDRMVGRTVIPAIYLWLLACGAVVGMGVAAPALQTVLRMWESEQSVEIENMGVELEHERHRDTNQHEHIMHLEKQAQLHEQEMDKITTDTPKSKK